MQKFNYSQQQFKKTPQMKRTRTDEVKNSAGGYTFQVNKWDRLRRFLILGSENGTYYIGTQKLVIENSNTILECIHENLQRTINTIVEISSGGLAYKNDPAIFALALCIAENPGNGRLPREAFLKIVRTGSQLLTFTSYINNLKGWGKGQHRLYEHWFNSQNFGNLVYQVIKYQYRDTWSHRDILRLVRPIPISTSHSALYKWITNRESSIIVDEKGDKFPTATGVALVDAYMEAHYGNVTEKRLITLIRDFNLTHEMIPTQFKNSPKVWEALSKNMPIHALIRNLAKMTSVNFLTADNFELLERFETMMNDTEYLKSRRIHPFYILLALKTYESGKGFRGKLTWQPVRRVVDTLNTGFYNAFRTVEPTNKRFCLAIDVSGSMGWESINNTNITPREAAAAMALITANVEPKYTIHAFDTTFSTLEITPKWLLSEVVKKTSLMPFRGTDCAQPIVHMHKQKKVYDVFIIYTDSETWAGSIKPHEALFYYRRDINPEAKLIVCAMTSNGFTIADPMDKGMLDIVGLDASVPELINQFALGNV